MSSMFKKKTQHTPDDISDSSKCIHPEELATNEQSNAALNHPPSELKEETNGSSLIFREEQGNTSGLDNMEEDIGIPDNMEEDIGIPDKAILITGRDLSGDNEIQINMLDEEEIGNFSNQDDLPIESATDSNQVGELTPDELTPLLHTTSRSTPKSFLLRASTMAGTSKHFNISKFQKYFVSFLFLLLLLVLILYYMAVDLNTIVQSAVFFDLKNVSVLDLTDNGINAHVIGSIHINYNNIDNHFYRSITKISSIILSSVIVKSNELQILLSTSSIPKSLHIATVLPPSFQIDLHQGSLTEVDFITKVDVSQENIVKLLDSIDSTLSDIVPIEITAVGDVSLDGKLVHFEKHRASLKTRYDIDRTKLDIPLDFKNLTITSDEASVEVYAEIEIQPLYPLNFTLDSLSWDILVYGCNENFISIGNWKSNKVHVIPNSPISFEVSGYIDEIPLDMLRECNNSTLTALNLILNHFLEYHTIPVFVRASEIKATSLPNWLFYILHEKSLQLNLVVPMQETIINSFNITSFGLDIPTLTSGKFDINFSSNLSIQADLPINIPLSITNCEANFSILDDNFRKILGGRTTDYTSIQIHGTNSSANIELDTGDLDIEFFDPKEIGSMIDLLLKESFNSTLYLNIDINQAEVISSLLTTNFYDLSIREIEITPSWQIPSLDLDQIIMGFDIVFQQMIYVSSEQGKIELLIDVEVTNPTMYSLDIPGEALNVGIIRNNSYFCSLQVDNLFIPAQASANLTVGMNIFVDSLKDRLTFNDLVSRYISGFSDLTVDISKIGAKLNKKLNLLLQQITVSSVKVPILKFDHGAVDIGSSHSLSRGTEPSPFLISAVIHILTSELEVVLYNPISNAELLVDLYHAEAKYDDQVLGNLARRELLLITPGEYRSPRLPIKLESGIGMDILKRAMNGNIEVNATALFNVKLDKFNTELMYYGSNLKSEVRL